MSVRFDASGDKLTRTSGLPSNMQSAFTVAGWVKITVDRNDWSTFCALAQATNNFVYIQTYSDGVKWQLWSQGGSVDIYTASVGTWVYLVMQIFQSGPWYASAAYVLAGGSTVNWTGSLSVGSSTPDLFSLGDSPFTGEFLNGSMGGVKVWTAALTDAEILREMYNFAPKRLSDLWGWYPFIPQGSASGYGTDYSGNGKTLTVGGTLAWEDNPPLIGWGADPLIYPKIAGGTVNYKTLDGSITPSGAGSGIKLVKLTASQVGSIIRLNWTE